MNYTRFPQEGKSYSLFPQIRVNTELSEILTRAFELYDKCPEIRKKILHDLDAYALGKKKKRLADAAWARKQTLPLGLNALPGKSQPKIRLAVPAIVAIDVARNGDATSGTLSFRIIAEEDPEWTVPMNLWPIIVEDNVPGAGYWSNTVFDQAFRDNVLGYYGEELVFEGPFPDTIFTEADYDIASTWNVNELHLATFVQCAYQANQHEVENCHWAKLLDIETGIGEAGWSDSSDLQLSVGPNPSTGNFNISAFVPGNGAGTIEVFNLAGRIVASGSVTEMQNFSVDESGIYLVRLSTSNGMSVTESVAVIR